MIVSDATNKNRYVDRWEEDVLVYTGTDAGMDNDGNQTLTGTGNNNKILYDTWFSNKMDQYALFLFVKLQRNQCTYKGRVKLASEPYQTQRIGDSKRRVWIFPLRLCTVDHQFVSDSLTMGENKAYNTDLNILKERIKLKKQTVNINPAKRDTISTNFDRDPDVSVYAKIRAKGTCDLCNQKAPFDDIYGRQYLESHHIIWLSKGGLDSIDNVVAPCPNCHRKMHIINAENDLVLLKNKIKIKNLNIS